MQQNSEARIATIAEGVELLIENVAALDASIEVLREAESKRGLWVLAGQADEEAAKALILLDVMRMDARDPKATTRQLQCFHQHLARCIYVEMVHMSPATFREVRTIVESMRPSHYLDGPNDVDWIYPNQLLAERERRLYVDLVGEDEGERWTTPAHDEEFGFGGPSPAVRNLVGSLARLGLTSAAGLSLVAETWSGREVEDETHWQEIVAFNGEIAERLVDKGLPTAEAEQADLDRLVSSWGFPLGGLDLSQRAVSTAELRKEQERWAPV